MCFCFVCRVFWKWKDTLLYWKDDFILIVAINVKLRVTGGYCEFSMIIN